MAYSTLAACLAICFVPVVVSEFCWEDVCEFTLILREVNAMTYTDPVTGTIHDVVLNGTELEALVPDASSCTTRRLPVDPADVITANGVPGRVMTVNNQFPGPVLEVIEYARVKVHIVNLLPDEAGSILHFHGMHMRGTAWHDGVPYVSSVPAPQGHAHYYDFTARPPGTHFYHSHLSRQKTLGLSGMFIVHRRQMVESPPPRANIPMMVSDWGNGDVLIDGRGRTDQRPFPLTEYTLQAGVTYRFRVVNSGRMRPLSVSIDGHKLLLRALDGTEIKPMVVDEVILHAAERADIEIVANRPPGRYWVRVRGTPFNAPIREGRAVLHYDGVTHKMDPTTRRTRCTARRPCVIFNCLQPHYPPRMFVKCRHVNEAKTGPLSLDLSIPPLYRLRDPDPIRIFLLSSSAGSSPSINHRSSPWPMINYNPDQSDEHRHLLCDNICPTSGAAICKCHHEIFLPFNRTVDLIMFTRSVPGVGRASAHPLHIHGHSMAILAQGFASINETTGTTIKPNGDIACESFDCLSPKWVGDRSRHNLVDPPLKDVVVVPADGYVVGRIISDNPGPWLFHCHMGPHMTNGLSLVFRESEESTWPPRP